MNNTSKFMSAFFGFSIIVVAIASYFFLKSDNAVGPNLITAFVGVVMSALITLILLNGQTKDEEEKERNLKLYNAKLCVYSDFVSKMYEFLKEDADRLHDIIELRTKLFGEVGFYAGKEVLIKIETELSKIKDCEEDSKFAMVFANIVAILQKDLRQETDIDTENDPTLSLWNTFQEIITKTERDKIKELKEEFPKQQSTELIKSVLEGQPLPQAWHFIMLNDTQLDKITKEDFKELSLIEYGEYWRTNLVKQVEAGDIIMLYRREVGYVGAFKAIGWRVFYFEEKREEMQMFGQQKQEITGKQYSLDIKAYDIYESGEDGATTCANIIIEPLAIVPNGVDNPGGIYRRTISRYDSQYALSLLENFKKTIEKGVSNN